MISVTRECFMQSMWQYPFSILKKKRKKKSTFAGEKKLSYRPKTLAYRHDSVNNKGVGPIWPHLFLLVCKAKIV